MRSDQVRVKLHISKPGETSVKNLWMCLNYDKKPTIEHIVEHVKDTYLNEEKDKFQIKLLLDEFWLPPYENSTILRENDIVKVEMKLLEPVKKIEEVKTVEKVCKKLDECSKTQHEYPVYDHMNFYYQQQATQPVYYLNNVDYNEYYKSLPKSEEVKKPQTSSPESDKKTQKTNDLKTQKKVPNKPKVVSNCYKKFAIGSYVHLLNEQEPVRDHEHMSEEQIIDDYYQTIQKQKTDTKETKGQLSSKSVDVDKIAEGLRASGQAKWKNSSQPKPANQMPKHIRFASSSSSDSSSEDEKIEPKKSAKKYYEPSREDQLKVQSNNKSQVVKNPKDLDAFNKMYDQKKLNAPKPENFIDEILSEVQSPKGTPKSSPSKMRRSPSPKIDYEKFESLSTAPRVNDKIAFKILEISANFTPEISGYKTGQVIEFDALTNEVTLKLFSKYNSILKRSSKFSVVLDDTEDEMTRLKKYEDKPEHENELPEDEQELLKVDWRNLINVKLLPNEEVLN